MTDGLKEAATKVAAALDDTARLWEAKDGAEMDVRIAKRAGDEDATKAAQGVASAALAEWHNAHLLAKDLSAALMRDLGIDPTKFRSVL